MKCFIIYFSKDCNSFYSKNLSIFVNIYFNNENINAKINEFKIDFYNESKNYINNFKDKNLSVYYLKDNIIRFIIDFIKVYDINFNDFREDYLSICNIKYYKSYKKNDFMDRFNYVNINGFNKNLIMEGMIILRRILIKIKKI